MIAFDRLLSSILRHLRFGCVWDLFVPRESWILRADESWIFFFRAMRAGLEADEKFGIYLKEECIFVDLAIICITSSVAIESRGKYLTYTLMLAKYSKLSCMTLCLMVMPAV